MPNICHTFNQKPTNILPSQSWGLQLGVSFCINQQKYLLDKNSILDILNDVKRHQQTGQEKHNIKPTKAAAFPIRGSVEEMGAVPSTDGQHLLWTKEQSCDAALCMHAVSNCTHQT